MNDTPIERLAVEQVDRDAAADYYYGSNQTQYAAHQERMRSGWDDEGHVVQAFARHRLAALSRHPSPIESEALELLSFVFDDPGERSSVGFYNIIVSEQVVIDAQNLVARALEQS